MDLPQPRSSKYVAILALISCLILVTGWLVRPRDIPQSPAPIPSESELALLARRAERRSLDSMAKYFAVTADEVASSIVELPRLATSGVVWDRATIVTAPLPRHTSQPVDVQSASGEDRLQPAIWGPRLPVAAVATGGELPGRIPARREASLPEAGAWVVALWRADRERVFAPGSYLQSASVSCGRTAAQEVVTSLSLNRMMAGGGLFDIDGNLLAVILPCDGRFAAIDKSSIDAILKEADTDQQRVLARFGLVFSALAEAEAAYFKIKSGVLVREVLRGSRGEEVGLMPGDVITEIDGTTVNTPDDLLPLSNPPDEGTFALSVGRGSTTQKIALSAGAAASSAAPAAPGAGFVWESPPAGYRIDAVVAGSRAARAGVEPGDRLVRIDRAEPQNPAQFERIFAGSSASPVLLEIERDDRRLAILLR